jgi:hypothetical protein
MDGLLQAENNNGFAPIPEEEETDIIEKCRKFLKRASDRWCSDIDDQELALEVAGGNFWGVGDNKKRWAILDKDGKDLIPTIPYNNISPQVNAIASPFSRSPFHINVVDKTEQTGGKVLQDAIVKIESSNNAKNVYQRAFTRGVTCAAGYIVVGTSLADGKVVPSVEFIADQKQVAIDPDCIDPSGCDAEEGAIISYISVTKAKREYGDDIVPMDYPSGQPRMSFAGITAWQDKTDKVQLVRYFRKVTKEFPDPQNGVTVKKTFVRMHTICGEREVREPVDLMTDIIPIVRFAGYTDYDSEYGQVYTGYVQKMMPQIEQMSLALTMQALRMRRCSNVRGVVGKSATEGCEEYFTDFEKGSAMWLTWNDKAGATPPQLVNDSFNTADITAALQEGRQTMQECTGVNLAGLDTTQRTAYEIMQQQINSESNVQELYIHAEAACHALGRIMLGILNNGDVPEFTLEGGPNVITAKMKTRSEIQAIAEMADPAHKELCAIRLAETIDSDVAKDLAQDLKANTELKLTEGQDVGTMMNVAEKLKKQLDEAMEKLEQAQAEKQELERRNYELELAQQNMKSQQVLQNIQFQQQMKLREAELAAKNATAAAKIAADERKLAIDAQKAVDANREQTARIIANRGY